MFLMLSFLPVGDIRNMHEDSSSEDMSPSDHKSLRNRAMQNDR